MATLDPFVMLKNIYWHIVDSQVENITIMDGVHARLLNPQEIAAFMTPIPTLAKLVLYFVDDRYRWRNRVRRVYEQPGGFSAHDILGITYTHYQTYLTPQEFAERYERDPNNDIGMRYRNSQNWYNEQMNLPLLETIPLFIYLGDLTLFKGLKPHLDGFAVKLTLEMEFE